MARPQIEIDLQNDGRVPVLEKQGRILQLPDWI